jgi:hypothetical protein
VASRLSPAAIASRVLTTLALLAASFAWAGWLFLRTVGDPGRAVRVADAVLADPRARAELSRDLVGLVGPSLSAVGVPADDPRVAAVVEAMLADRRLADALLDAVAAAHATALGDTPAAPATIDTAVLTAVLRDQLATIDPALAAAVPQVSSGGLTLPTVEIPGLGTARSVIADAVGPLAAVAAAGVAGAFALGGRSRVLRRSGRWAVGAGLAWVVVPRLVTWIAEQWASGHAGTVRAVAEAASADVRDAAVGLVVTGAGLWWGGVVWDRLVPLLQPTPPVRAVGRRG